jgi:hypothetical protein
MFVGLDNGLGKTMKLISPSQLTSQAEVRSDSFSAVDANCADSCSRVDIGCLCESDSPHGCALPDQSRRLTMHSKFVHGHEATHTHQQCRHRYRHGLGDCSFSYNFGVMFT